MITIDLESEVPIFKQLVEQVKKAVDRGLLQPGDGIPSIRQLAGDLDIGPKTVAKAYQLLERDKIIRAKGYRGSFIHEDAKDNTKTDIKLWLDQEMTRDVLRYRRHGATDSEIRIALANALNVQIFGGKS